MRYMYTYLATQRDGSEKFSGHIIADSKFHALQIITNNNLTPIYVARAWFFQFNRALIIDWFGNLNKLLKAGFKIDKALLLVSKHAKIDISMNLLECLRAGESFGVGIQKNELFFGAECSFIAKYLHDYVGVEDLCKFLYEYNEFVAKNQKEIRAQLFLPILSFLCCMITFIIILSLIIYNLDIILGFIQNKNSLWIQILRLIKDLGIFRFGAVLTISTALFLKFGVFESRFVKEYYLAKEASFVFYVLSRYISYGLHLSSCFEILLKILKKTLIFDDIKIIKSQLEQGMSLSKGFDSCGYLSKYAYVVHVYENCGKIDQLFPQLSKMEEAEITDKISFVKDTLPLIFFGLSAATVIFACAFVILGFMRLDFL